LKKNKFILLILLLGVAFLVFMNKESSSETVTLIYDSFDGGGPQYEVVVHDESIVSVSSNRKYHDADHEELDGASYDMIFTFCGLQEGKTKVEIIGESALTEENGVLEQYVLIVNEKLNIRKSQILPLESFYFRYGGYMAPISYELWKEEEIWYLSVNEGEPVEAELSLVEELEEMITGYEIGDWNGFSEADRRVLDGEDFLLSIHFEDGKRISANGSNAFPKNYGEAKVEWNRLLGGF